MLFSFCSFGASAAQAAPPSEETQQCVAASTQGQTDRDEGHLLAAREQLLSCAREVCPPIVRKSCADWLTEVDVRIPSVVVRVQQAGRDVTNARVKLDRHAIPLDGRPLTLNPGTHVLTVEKGEHPPQEQSFLIGEREQARLILVELPAEKVVEEASPVIKPAVVKPAAASFSVPTLAWVLGGVGVAGIATFTVLRIQLGNQLHELERTCAPRCSDQQRDDGKHKALIADISLGVGIAALAGGVAVALGSYLAQRDEPSFALVPTAGGALATYAGRF